MSLNFNQRFRDLNHLRNGLKILIETSRKNNAEFCRKRWQLSSVKPLVENCGEKMGDFGYSCSTKTPNSLDFSDFSSRFSCFWRGLTEDRKFSLLPEYQRLILTSKFKPQQIMLQKSIKRLPTFKNEAFYYSTKQTTSNFDDKNEEKKKIEEEKQKLYHKSRERRVPSSRTARLANYGGLAFGLGVGAIAEVFKRQLGVSNGNGTGLLDQSPFLTKENAERIVNTLCKVRGAALKLGQMISIQDNAIISPELQQIFERVRYGADFMPLKQLHSVLERELGRNWREKFQTFEDKPLAAASIGQVHRAVTNDGREIALKVQYPGVAEGIESDINNLTSILTYSNLLPKGLYLESMITVAREELALECDYLNEAESSKKFKQLIAPYPDFYVPYVVDDLTTKHLFASELIFGLPLDKCENLDQETRNWIGERILRLCLKELFIFKFMQTDPNWSNFFYDAKNRRIILLDFGACRRFGKKFTDQYLTIIKAAADKDKKKIVEYSRKIGFLTGYESKIMEDAHSDAVLILGEAFSSGDVTNFGMQDTTRRIQSLVPVMLKHRLTPPPDEIYSLHRKMSGAFLLCAKLKCQIQCKTMFDEIYSSYKFDPENL